MLLFLGLGKKKLAFSFSFPIPNPPWWYILYHLDGMLLSWWYISHRNGLWWCCFQPKNSTWWYISSTLLGKWSSHEHFNALKSSWNGIWWVYPTTKSIPNPKLSKWITFPTRNIPYGAHILDFSTRNSPNGAHVSTRNSPNEAHVSTRNFRNGASKWSRNSPKWSSKLAFSGKM